MAEMKLTPQAQTLLDQLRHVDDPTPAERVRADAAVRRVLASQGLQDLPPLTTPTSGAPTALNAPKSLLTQRLARTSALTSRSSKLLWGLGLGAAAVAATLGLVTVGAPRKSDPRTPPEGSSLHAEDPTATEITPGRAVDDTAATPSLEPTASARRSPAPSLAPTEAQRAARVPAARESLADELRFLSSLDADIRAGNYDTVLRRLAKHRAPSPLQQERAAMRVLALCGRDGDDKHAARARDSFLRAAPHSVLAERVRAACGAESEP